MPDILGDKHMEILSEFRDLLEDRGVVIENVHVDPEPRGMWVSVDAYIRLDAWEESADE